MADPQQIDSQNVQLPVSGANPAAMATLMPGAMSPVQPTTPDQNAQLIQSILQQSQVGQQAFQQQLQRAQGVGNMATGALQQNLAAHPVQQMPMAGLSQEPWMKMQPVTGQGAGGDIKNAVEDVGRGILQGFASGTGVGRNIQSGIYGPKLAQYKEGQEQRAAAITGLQGQQKTEEEPIASAASLAYRPYMAAASEQRATAEIQRAGSYAQYVTQTGDYHTALLGMDEQHLTLDQKALEVKSMLGEQGIQVQQERNNILLSLGNQKMTVDQAQFNAAVQNNDQGFFDQLMIGLGLRQPAQVTPGQTQPQQYQPATPPAKHQAAAQPTRPANVPSNYVFKTGSKGQGWYKPGTN